MSGPNPPFIGSSPALIVLPSGGPEGLQSVRVVPPAQGIQIVQAGDAVAEASAISFQPVQAIELDCNTRVDESCAGDGYPSRVNNAMSRFWVYLDSVAAGFGLAGAQPGVIPPAVPDPFELQVRVASGAISETIFQCLVTPTSYKDNGLIVGLDGYLGTRYEIWGRIPNVRGTAYPLLVKFQLIVDRLSQVRTQFPPFKGRLTTIEAIQYYP